MPPKPKTIPGLDPATPSHQPSVFARAQPLAGPSSPLFVTPEPEHPLVEAYTTRTLDRDSGQIRLASQPRSSRKRAASPADHHANKLPQRDENNSSNQSTAQTTFTLPRNLTAEIRAQHDAKFIAEAANGPTPADLAAATEADIIPLSAAERQQMEIEGRKGWKGFECPICGYDASLRRLLLQHIRKEHYGWWLKNGANVKYVVWSAD